MSHWLIQYNKTILYNIFQYTVFYFEGFTSIPTALTANDRNRIHKKVYDYISGGHVLLESIFDSMSAISNLPSPTKYDVMTRLEILS